MTAGEHEAPQGAFCFCGCGSSARFFRACRGMDAGMKLILQIATGVLIAWLAIKTVESLAARQAAVDLAAELEKTRFPDLPPVQVQRRVQLPPPPAPRPDAQGTWEITTSSGTRSGAGGLDDGIRREPD